MYYFLSLLLQNLTCRFTCTFLYVSQKEETIISQRSTQFGININIVYYYSGQIYKKNIENLENVPTPGYQKLFKCIYSSYIIYYYYRPSINNRLNFRFRSASGIRMPGEDTASQQALLDSMFNDARYQKYYKIISYEHNL